MRILIAEDHNATRLILEAAVRSLGHDCVSASDGEEAWQLFQNVDVDAVISDRMMPGMDGLELCRRIRANGRATYTYFVFVTGFDEKTEVIHGMEAGADDYLIKPLDVDELKMRLLVAARVTSIHRELSRQSAELEGLNHQLFEQSRADPLTKLGNRLRLREDLEVIRVRVQRYGHTYCAVMCDIDGFKAYNDSNGHLAGDDVLCTVARILISTSREGDQAYRYGGEEFLILLPEQSVDSGLAAAERYRRAVEKLAIPHVTSSVKRVVTISAGVASLSQLETKSVEAWLNEADAALYRAKQLGRNCVARYEKQPAILLPHRSQAFGAETGVTQRSSIIGTD
jgi:two-component system, cell cycle response regulator